jgi:hypothetical protein
MNSSAQELISLTTPNLIQKEGLVQKNQRIEIIIDTLAYLVMKKVDLDEMKCLIGDLNGVIENS